MWRGAPRVSLKEYMMVGLLRDEMVEDVAAILMTGWLTPWRFGDAAAFMSVHTHEKAVSGCLRTKLLFLLHLLLQLAYELLSAASAEDTAAFTADAPLSAAWLACFCIRIPTRGICSDHGLLGC